MPNFQGAVNETISQAGLYSALAGGPQDLKERIRLGKEEKALNKQTEAATSTGIPLRPEVEEDLAERSRDIARRNFELKPSAETYKEYAKQLPIKTPPDGPEIAHEERMADIPDEARRAAEYDHAYREAYNREFSRLDKMSQAISRAGRQSEAMTTQKDNIRKHIEGLPTSLGGKVKDLDPVLREQIIKKYMEANDGK